MNKLLFFADLSCFLNTGRTISGSDYFRMQYGPVTEELDVTRLTLIKSNFLVEERKTIQGHYHYIYTVDEDKVDLDAVEASLVQDELDAINAVREKLARKAATYLSERTHAFEPWKSGGFGDLLDLSRTYHDAKLIRWLQRNGMVQKNVQTPILL